MSIQNIHDVRMNGVAPDQLQRRVRVDRDGYLLTKSADDAGGGLTDAELRATPVPVAATQTTSPWVVAVTSSSGSAGAVDLFSDFGANATAIVKNAAGNVFSLASYNANPPSKLTRFVQLHSKTLALSGGDIPIIAFPVPFAVCIVIGQDFFSAGGIYFSQKIRFAWSSTIATYTAAPAAEHITFVTYK